jgi:endonuclease YncB( thermonuclease family)
MVFRPAHLLCLALAAPAAASACGAPGATAELREAGPGGEIGLSDGRRVRLGGVQLAPGAQAAMGDWIGRRVGVATLAAEPDRWGRTVVDLVDPSGPSLALDLVTRGLAFVRPEPASRGCDGERFEAEAAARAAGEGAWADGAVLAAQDAKALAAADGRFVVVEGVVRGVGEGRAKVYLDFGAKGGFSVTVSRKAEDRFRRAGVDLSALAGRKVLVRGVVDNRFGPRIEIADPAMIEMLETDASRGG